MTAGLEPIDAARLEASIQMAQGKQLVCAPAALPDVYRAINAVAKAISKDGIGKGRKNEQQGYSFRGIDDVYNALSALIAGADLCILPRMRSHNKEERATKDGKGVLFYVTVKADFVFVSSRDGSRHTVTTYGEAMDSGDKATNKAMSAAYKYACMQVFCIPTEGMADADSTTYAPEPRESLPKPIPPKAATQPNPHAAQQQVAAQKIATGNPGSLAPPWKNMGQLKTAMKAIREAVGETEWLAELARYGWRNAQDMQRSFDNNEPLAREKAIELYTHLEAIARKDVA